MWHRCDMVYYLSGSSMIICCICLYLWHTLFGLDKSNFCENKSSNQFLLLLYIIFYYKREEGKHTSFVDKQTLSAPRKQSVCHLFSWDLPHQITQDWVKHKGNKIEWVQGNKYRVYVQSKLKIKKTCQWVRVYTQTRWQNTDGGRCWW